MRALQQLRPEQRRMLELGFVHGLSQSAISSTLSIPLGTVKSYMRRGLLQVREYLQTEAGFVSSRDPPVAGLARPIKRESRRNRPRRKPAFESSVE
jgi:hypothetical protein